MKERPWFAHSMLNPHVALAEDSVNIAILVCIDFNLL